MGWNDPISWADGDYPGGETLNKQLRDNMLFLKSKVEDSAPQDLTYAGSFGVGTPGQIGYRLLAGVVYLYGGASLSSGSYAAGMTTVATLPAGLGVRPGRKWGFGTWGNSRKGAVMEINTDGTITIGPEEGVTGLTWAYASCSFFGES